MASFRHWWRHRTSCFERIELISFRAKRIPKTDIHGTNLENKLYEGVGIDFHLYLKPAQNMHVLSGHRSLEDVLGRLKLVVTSLKPP